MVKLPAIVSHSGKVVVATVCIETGAMEESVFNQNSPVDTSDEDHKKKRPKVFPEGELTTAC